MVSPDLEKQASHNSPSSTSHGGFEEHEELHEGQHSEQSQQPLPPTSDHGLHENHNVQRPSLPRTVSAQSKIIPVKKVPRASRTGLFARLSLLYEAEEPKHYPRVIKWYITFVIGLAAFAAPMGSSIVYPALGKITEEFGSSPTVTNLSVALYMLAMSIFPIWWSSFSETAGRRSVYIISFTVLALWNVLAAVADSISMFIIMRFLSGGASAAVQAVGAGTIADVWEVKERGRAMGIFYLGPLCGPLLSPIIGGALTQGLGWRSTQWFQAIYGAVTLLLLVFGLPETHKLRKALPEPDLESTQDRQDEKADTAIRPQLSRQTTRRSAARHTQRAVLLLHRIFIEPLKIILYIRFPPVALTVYYASIAFGSLYFLNISVEKTFSASPYSFSVIIVGCLYLFNSVGYLITSVLGGKWVDWIMRREARRAGRIDPATGKPLYLPEDRMRENIWLAAFIMPAALIWYGWTAQFGVHWAVPMIANFFFGAGSMLVFAAATTMLTEFMPRTSSNGVAINNLCRNIFAFLGVLLAEPLIDAIGNGPLFTIAGAIAGASCFVIVLMRRYGQKWRVEMDRQLV